MTMTKEEYLEHVKNNELCNRDPDIYDIEDAWTEGYKEAYSIAAEWLEKETPKLFFQSCDLDTAVKYFVNGFRNEMEL